MKNMKWIILSITALCLSATACVDQNSSPSPEWKFQEEGDEPELEGVFVSGHLGNYVDCPSDGYTPESNDNSMDDPGELWVGDCAAEMDSCTGFENCEDAQVTVVLENSGEATALGVDVVKIELFDEDGTSQATLPLMGVSVSGSSDEFDGEIEVDEEQILRVDFQGPQSPYELLRSADGDMDPSGTRPAGFVEITFASDNHDDVIIMSTEIYSVPSVET